MNTPIKTWPVVKFRGSPGYSARHNAALAGAPEDPLRVAERILSQEIGEQVSVQTEARIAAGESVREVTRWQSEELTRARAASWTALCESFDMVIAALERAPKTPVMQRLIRQAKQAARKVTP